MADRTLKVQVKLETDQKELNNLQLNIKKTMNSLNSQVADVKNNIQSALATGLSSNSLGTTTSAISSISASVNTMKTAWKSAESNINGYVRSLQGTLNEYEYDLKLVEKEVAKMGNIPLSSDEWDKNKISDTADMREISGRWYAGDIPTYRELAELALELKSNIELIKEELAQVKGETLLFKQAMAETEVEASKAKELLAQHKTKINLNTEALKKHNAELENSQKQATNLGGSFKGILKYAKRILLAFGIGTTIRVIKRVINEVKLLMSSLSGWLPKSIQNITNVFLVLKGQVNASLAELFATLEPRLIKIMQFLTEAFEWVSKIIAVLNGKTTYYKAVLVNENSLQEQVKSAKELKKVLMGFDEINQITGDTDSTASGSSDLNYKLVETPLSEEEILELEKIIDKLKIIRDIVLIIAGFLALWKLVNFISDLGTVIDSLGTIGKPLGIILSVLGMIEGVHLEIKGIKDIWNNGIDWGNVGETVGGMATADVSAGLFAVFLGQPFSYGFAPAAAITGLSGYVASLKSIWDDGLNLKNLTLGTVSATGAGAGIAGMSAMLTGENVLTAMSLGAPEALAFAIPIMVDVELAKEAGAEEDLKGDIERFRKLFNGESGLEGLGDEIKQDFDNIGASWNNGITTFNEDVNTSVTQADTDLSGDLERFKNTWELFSTWIGGVWDGIKTSADNFFPSLKEDVSGSLESADTDWGNDLERIKNTWNNFKTGVSDIWDGICTKWNDIKTWFSNCILDVKNFIRDLKSAIKIPKLNISYTTTTNKALNWMGITELPHLSLSWVNAFANGGFPDMGQLFLARESGPELVGKMGNQNAVMNNEQIVSAVSQGVATAVANVMGSGNNNRDIVLEINGREFCRATYNDFNRVQKEHGQRLFA